MCVVSVVLGAADARTALEVLAQDFKDPPPSLRRLVDDDPAVAVLPSDADPRVLRVLGVDVPRALVDAVAGADFVPHDVPVERPAPELVLLDVLRRAREEDLVADACARPL